MLTFVTASMKCNSETGEAVLLEKVKARCIEGSEFPRSATISIFKPLLLTIARCSLGRAGVAASGGSAEENDHSSSSFVATKGAGAGDTGFEND